MPKQTQTHSNNYTQFLLCFRLGNETTLTFGICVPADCSMDFLQNYFNQISNKKDSIKLLENSCQVQENSINFTVLDWIAV